MTFTRVVLGCAILGALSFNAYLILKPENEKLPMGPAARPIVTLHPRFEQFVIKYNDDSNCSSVCGGLCLMGMWGNVVSECSSKYAVKCVCIIAKDK